METQVCNPVFGSAPRSAPKLTAPYLCHRRLPTPIWRQLEVFLRDEIKAWAPDLIIVVERRGTAILRALMESKAIIWQWDDVISSTVINQVRDDKLLGRKILVFDDLMHRGTHLEAVLRALGKRCVDVSCPDTVRTAVFAVHTDGSQGRQYEGRTIPDSWFLRNVTTQSHRAVRSQIVEFLQQSGSLMLDTEHIEIRTRFRGSFVGFQEALSRQAEAVQFYSLADRPNVTVYYSDDYPHKISHDIFPKDTVVDGIVKKCRIVHRTAGEFAIIPICYPGTPLKYSESWPREARDVALLGRVSELKDDARVDATFYAAGLLAALNVLGWVVKALSAADPTLYPLSLPGIGSDEPPVSPGSYTLEHLRVMYPNLDTAVLYDRIASDVLDAQGVGANMRGRRFDRPPTLYVEDSELRANAVQLLQIIRSTLDDRIVNRCLLGDNNPKHPDGLTAAEIFALGRSYCWEDARISALFDILIDDAHLITHKENGTRSNPQVAMRTFEPDGEIVSELIRRVTTQWGSARRQ